MTNYSLIETRLRRGGDYIECAEFVQQSGLFKNNAYSYMGNLCKTKLKLVSLAFPFRLMLPSFLIRERLLENAFKIRSRYQNKKILYLVY